ncbi:MAG: Palmitoyltransferase [Piccolia ochrophora]|nr:MAG: Palmitoyltransferase [Piccolia ochrophora]
MRRLCEGPELWEGPDGVKVRLVKQEFPYDIGIWKNLKQGMGGGNVLEWFWPFAKTPSIEGALDYEVNGFEDTGVSWPPPDPERIPRASRLNDSGAFMYKGADMGPTNEVEAFRRRQQVDLKRWQVPDHSALADGEEGGGSDGENSASSAAMDEEPWTNAEGDRLKDFGVDEEEELYDEDDIPLAELMKKRR